MSKVAKKYYISLTLSLSTGLNNVNLSIKSDNTKTLLEILDEKLFALTDLKYIFNDISRFRNIGVWCFDYSGVNQFSSKM